jgi:aminopeptidase N
MGLARKELLYDKSAALLNHIRQQIGDKQFLLFLRAYQRNFAWKEGSTQHVVGLLNFITKRDFNPLFDACFWGDKMPGKN